MRRKSIIVIALILIMITVSMPVTSFAASATAPASVTVDDARTRLTTLVSALKDNYFTTTGSTCHTPAESSHPQNNHSACNLGSVVKASWLKNKIDLLPNMDVISITHYGPGGASLKNGWSCAAFADFASWYVYAKKSTDKVTFKNIYEGKDTKAAMAKARPGDIIRTSSGHSMVFIQNLSNGTQYQVIDCNYTSVGSSEGNCKIKVHARSYDGYTIVLNRANNLKDEFKLITNLNYSGKNYVLDSDFQTLNTTYWKSNDTSVSTISIDTSNKHNGYNSLKIANSAAGASGKDIVIKTLTNGRILKNYLGDNKEMILSFWARSSKSGTKMYFRWGLESTSNYRNISLTTEWKKYTVRMDKTPEFTDSMQPYINQAGTVWIAEVQLEDGTTATDFVPETEGIYQTVTSKYGNTYTYPAEPVRSGYTFLGWYTAATGGKKFTSTTAVKNGHINAYAHWNEVPEPEAAIISHPQSVTVNEGETATFSVTTSGDISSYQWQYRTGSSGSWYNISGTAAMQATYSFTAEATQNGYQYRCVVTAANGNTLNSSEATLTVIASSEPVAAIISQPMSVTVNEGDTATFSVTTSGDVNGYQWQYRKNSNYIWNNINESAAKQATYSFTAGSTQNNYQFRCIVTDANGIRLYSAVAILTVIQASGTIDISDAMISFRGLDQTEYGEYWLTYDGTPKTPEVIVTLDGQVLSSNSYSVTYASNINMGYAYVTVSGYGNYTGVVGSSFIICYKDVPGTHNFHPGVYWATDMGIAAGYSGANYGTFGVSDAITRGQVVMFLWRAAGYPEPARHTQTFSDVPTSHNFYKAIQWAVEQGITGGYTGARAGQFGPSDNCTRGQIVTFLWRYAGWPEPSSHAQTFSDVPTTSNFYTSIQWASEQGITAGYSDGTFGINKTCTRGHCVTFLYRLLAE